MLVLKILGLTLLCALGLILAAVCAALFCGLRYKAEATSDGGLKLKVRIKAAWLFYIVRFYYELDGGSRSDVYILWFSLKRAKERRRKRAERAAERGATRLAKKNAPVVDYVQNPAGENAGAGAEKASDSVSEPPSGDKVGVPPESKQEKSGLRVGIIRGRSSETHMETSEKEATPEKGESKIKGMFNKLKEYYGTYKSISGRTEIIRLTKQLVKRLFRALGIKKFGADGVFSLGSPCNTGRLFGLVSMVKGLTALPVNLSADFESETRFDLRVKISGRTSMFRILLPLIGYIFKKPVWSIIKKLRKREKA